MSLIVRSFANYCYVERIKLLASVFFPLMTAIATILSAILLFGFVYNVYDNFSIHLIRFPESDFDSYFLSTLTWRIRYLYFFFLLALSLLSLDLESQTKFFSVGMKVMPVDVMQFLLAKIVTVFCFAIFWSLVLSVIIPLVVNGSYDRYIIRMSLDEPSIVNGWICFILYAIPSILLIMIISLLLSHRLVIVFFVCNLLYFLSTKYPIYPFAGVAYASDMAFLADAGLSIACSLILAFICKQLLTRSQ